MDGVVNHPVFKKLFTFIDNFIYSLTNELIIAFGAVFGIFVFFIILSVAFNHNKILSFFFLSTSFIVIAAGPVAAYEFVEMEYKKTEFRQIEIRQLVFKDEISVSGFLVNKSAKILSDCRVEAKVYGKTDSPFKRFMGLAKPKSKAVAVIEKEIYPNTIGYFKLNAGNVQYKDEVDLSLKVRCR